MRKRSFARFVYFLAFLIILAALCGTARAAQSPLLVTSSIDEGQLVSEPRGVHPLARSEFDRGAAPDALPMERMLLVLKRSAEQQEALDKFLQELQQPWSPNYHKWLTPDQFGEQFGASDADIQVITTWLEGHGFQVERASRGRTIIEFSGNAGQVRQAFHTEIHKFVVAGREHWANADSPKIPAALALAVAGVSTLHDFVAAPQSSVSEAHVPVAPQFTTSSGNSYLSPGDYATIYNAKPLYPAITGTGVTIAVVGRSNINIQDVISFRSVMGLPANPPKIILNGANPGDLGGGEEIEALLDTSWAGAIATGATVDFVVSASTNTTDGVTLSEIYIINNNLGGVMTESFGSCEASFTSAQEASISSLAQQAAAQGITYLVSSGDSGSAGCDDPNTETTATQTISVNGLASTPYNIAVGGSQFNENGAPSVYWNSSNASNRSSARSYIPEDVWNANCTGALCGTGSILASGGGASTFFTKPSWQTGVAGIPNDGVRDVPDVSLSAAGHDPYLLCVSGSCSASPASFEAVYGTSASAPSFASIVALIDQKTGARQGQLAPRLYSVAAAQNLAACNGSNTSALPAANCVFNDVTIGTNAVPGEPHYNSGNETYSATAGFDLASGLGSVNVANLVNNWSVTVAVPAAALSPNSLIFATQTIGTASASQSVTLSNTGAAVLSIASIAVSGTNAGDFTVSNNCGSALAAGSSCNIAVIFKPGAAGTRSASLIVTDNSGNVAGSTQSTTLAGTGAAPAGNASASYAGADAATLGTWTGKYGADGQLIANDLTNVPSYASVTFTNASTWTWTTVTSDPRALQSASGSSARISSTYYAYAPFTIDVNLTDGNTHKISLYLCDWDFYGRAETISIVDASSGTVLDSRAFSSFSGGVYEAWNIKGHVEIEVTYTAGINGIVNAIFFDAAGSTTTASASASYVGADAATQGTWTGKYGTNGQLIANDLTNVPSYASVNFTGASTWTWTTATTDPRALQSASGSSARISSAYYAYSPFTIDVNLTDGNTHKISLYLCDWDSQGRAETISIVDAASGTVLDSRAFSSFSDGIYEAWNIKGHVQIEVTYTAGINGIVNAIFFDAAGSTTAGSASASYAGADAATQGGWTGKYGADGQLIANDLTNAPSYATVNFTGASTWTWTTVSSDPRALQSASGSSARISSTYYAYAPFTIDVNLTDGNIHKISLYLCDWDLYGRAETISIVDASSGTVLDSRAFSSFTSGVYEAWNIKGHVQIEVTYTAGINGIVNAIFFN